MNKVQKERFWGLLREENEGSAIMAGVLLAEGTGDYEEMCKFIRTEAYILIDTIQYFRDHLHTTYAPIRNITNYYLPLVLDTAEKRLLQRTKQGFYDRGIEDESY